MDDTKRDSGVPRRRFLSLAAMGGALTAAYGFFASMVFRFLSPKREDASLTRMFVAFATDLNVGSSRNFYTPKGEQVMLTNTGQLQAEADHTFIAFSSRCPHLGCKVHYEAKSETFICPCHQGAFDQKGIAVAGPPADAGQRLSEFDVVQDGNSIYVMVEV